jgi:hypothetical protein
VERPKPNAQAAQPKNLEKDNKTEKHRSPTMVVQKRRPTNTPKKEEEDALREFAGEPDDSRVDKLLLDRDRNSPPGSGQKRTTNKAFLATVFVLGVITIILVLMGMFW